MKYANDPLFNAQFRRCFLAGLDIKFFCFKAEICLLSLYHRHPLLLCWYAASSMVGWLFARAFYQIYIVFLLI
jgi:hypothetical protein